MVLAESRNKVGLGRALMNSRGGVRGRGRGRGSGSKGPVEMLFKAPENKQADGYGIRSITEQNDLDEFLTTAELADTDFTAEKMANVQVIHKDQFNPYLLTADQEKTTLQKQHAHEQHLTVPRRPKWDASTTREKLDRSEKEAFLNWRREMANLQETKDLLMTPFERNIEVWRQLWRVLERSDLVVQIVDARNPLMFRSLDLENYVKELDPRKQNLLLINKADMLTFEQRNTWAAYFEKEGVQYKFFSAALAKERNGYDSESELESEGEDSGMNEDVDSSLIRGTEALRLEGDRTVDEDTMTERPRRFNEEWGGENDPRVKIITVDELEDLFLKHAPESTGDNDSYPRKTTIGLVGYPNVGKSSTINALIGAKKVSVSATPGKTKHFQTLHLSDQIILCDCPGLVFPNFATTKAELVCNGILPIDQQREYTAPATLVARRIPQLFLEGMYGIKIRTRPLEEGGTGMPTGEELLVAYAKARGYMKTGGSGADDSRAARYILKDYINGKLLFCFPPPSDPPLDPLEFNRGLYNNIQLPERRRTQRISESVEEEGAKPASGRVELAPEGSKTNTLDKEFFGKRSGNSGYMLNPFLRGAQAPAVDGNARILSGRKAKQMLALEHGLSREEVQELVGGKKHFKGKLKIQKKKKADDYVSTQQG